MSDLNGALRTFEAAEANLAKLERLWKEIRKLTPDGIAFGSDPQYEDVVRSYEHVLASLPRIDGWVPTSIPRELDAIAQARFDAQEIGEPEMFVSVEQDIEEPAKELREYRFRFDRKRRELTRNAINSLIETISELLHSLHRENARRRSNTSLDGNPQWKGLREIVHQIDVLLGSSVPRPPRWEDLNRHLRFAQVKDLNDIITFDWPEVSAGIAHRLYAADEPVPVNAGDLSDIVKAKPTGQVATALEWSRLTPEDFERLIFALISNEATYENPEWLMETSAPDRGRDLSVTRVIKDALTGTRRERIIIQCRHVRSRSISPSDITILRDQVQQWEPPQINELIIVTSGRFSADAVSMVERQNQSNSSLKIQMWPESHLERLLAARPSIIAEFNLR